MNMTSTLNQIPAWTFKADYVETCNCNYGCPCNFDGFPSNGFCRTLVLFHIRSGNYGDTSLDGIDVISAISWPKAIHEGNGTAQLFISKNNTNNERRNAIISIFSGQAKGEGPFALFAGTIKFFLEPQFVDMLVKIDGKKSSFSVPGIIDVQSESFVNPVTGEEQDTRIQLPKGFVWKLAEMAKTKGMKITTPQLNYDHSGKNALYSVIEYNGP
ncbi:DUF1326 domain-containing protein [Candidatus Nitrosocosmicus sp. SS]|jgi:hypothetical protein|nr:DUF1326 domain-containing protein [Candidatus Nitrosocosmicus sp. SS]KAF0869575.1 DUF1326 domain-containing protein [Candidatus Nitrosocosmicus sp. SS]